MRHMHEREITTVLPYMKARGESDFKTENYVETPPALWVVESDGTVWTLGQNHQFGPRGEFQFDVLRNGAFTGEWASRIKRQGGKIRIFTCEGMKTWTGRSFF